jgi:small ligand-binding sensory domain FIST
VGHHDLLELAEELEAHREKLIEGPEMAFPDASVVGAGMDGKEERHRVDRFQEQRVPAFDWLVGLEAFHDRRLLIRVGKKKYHLLKII